MEIQDAKQARPHCELIAELLDSRQPKTEREHAAVREIERLRHDIERHIAIASEHATECESLRAELAEWQALHVEQSTQILDLTNELAEALERAPRWRDVVDELPTEAQEVLFVRGGKTVHGAWIGGIFWHNNQKMAAAYWMPLPLPPEESK